MHTKVVFEQTITKAQGWPPPLFTRTPPHCTSQPPTPTQVALTKELKCTSHTTTLRKNKKRNQPQY